MIFITILIALLIERFFDWNYQRRWGWFINFQSWVSRKFVSWSSYSVLLLSIIIPVLLVALVNHLLNDWFYNVPKLVFGIFVLIYCFGPANFWAQFYACISALHKEEPLVAIKKIQDNFNVVLPEDLTVLHPVFTGRLFVEANRRIFAVAFWFLILGPAGALIYRLIDLCHLKGSAIAPTALKLQQLLDWIPVRLLTFFFALGGHFTQAMRIWKHSFFSTTAVNDSLLQECGIAAVDVMEEQKFPEDGSGEQEALSLLDRAFIIGLVFLALIVLL